MGMIKRKTITIACDFDMDEISDEVLNEFINQKINEIIEHKACITLYDYAEESVGFTKEVYYK